MRSDSHQQLLAAFKADSTNEAQSEVFLAPRPMAELYRVTDDPYQLNNLAADTRYQGIENSLSGILKVWRQETGDSVPKLISEDQFDRETGERIAEGQSFRQETPGESENASEINRHGPR